MLFAQSIIHTRQKFCQNLSLLFKQDPDTEQLYSNHAHIQFDSFRISCMSVVHAQIDNLLPNISLLTTLIDSHLLLAQFLGSKKVYIKNITIFHFSMDSVRRHIIETNTIYLVEGGKPMQSSIKRYSAHRELNPELFDFHTESDLSKGINYIHPVGYLEFTKHLENAVLSAILTIICTVNLLTIFSISNAKD